MEQLSGPIGFLLGRGLISQLLLTVIIIVIVYVIISMMETLYTLVKRMDQQTTALFPNTTPGKQLIVQAPDAQNLIYNSQNEQNGMEFSYSMYLFISPDTFEATVQETCGGSTSQKPTYLKHIMHKGSKAGFPLMAPGLFVEGNKNTLRLYMNSSTKPDNYVEIPNIPIGKWFHLVITLKGKYLDVYINGNVTVRHQFDVVPKLNFGNVYVLYPIQFPKPDMSVNTPFRVDNAAKGMVSRLNYYAYALNYSQIDALYREGPSKVIVNNNFTEIPPYFHDDWWVNKY